MFCLQIFKKSQRSFCTNEYFSLFLTKPLTPSHKTKHCHREAEDLVRLKEIKMINDRRELV